MSNGWTVGVLTLHCSSRYLCTELNEPHSLNDQRALFVSNERLLWFRLKLWYALGPQTGTHRIPSDLFQLVVCLLLADTLPYEL